VEDNRRFAQRSQESALSVQLLSVLEAERKRIATELHDDIGQILTSIKMRVDTAMSLIQMGRAANAEQALAGVVPMVQETMDEVRRISMDLRPSILDDLGIVATITWFCRNFAKTYPGIRIEPDLRIEEREVPEGSKIVLYRVLQEAMNNIARHADAHFVRVQLLRRDQNLELTVEDDGCGFDVAGETTLGLGRQGTGLASMRERLEAAGGSLSIQSTMRVGTVVRGILPCNR
jgi:signal transduction histidine kinase